jgi:FtsH-binding integral membrane protein
VLAIGAGFFTLAVLVSIATAWMRHSAPQWTTPARHDGDVDTKTEATTTRLGMAVNLAASMLFAAVGGAVTALLAPARPLLHTLMLSLAVLIVSALAVHDLRDRARATYQVALLALTPMAALGGGILLVLLR